MPAGTADKIRTRCAGVKVEPDPVATPTLRGRGQTETPGRGNQVSCKMALTRKESKNIYIF